MDDQHIKILREQSIGETRAVAFDMEGRPFKLFIDRFTDAAQFAAFGRRYPARVRSIAKTQGGIFVELEDGQAAVLRPDPNRPVHEGMSVDVEVAAEAYLDKRPRVILSTYADTQPDPFDIWLGQFPNAHIIDVEDVAVGNKDIQTAFDAALENPVTLAGGGKIRIAPTSALTAIDIDTAGRSDRGSAGSRALKVNTVAVEEIARQIELRAIGGLIVIDCLAPLNKEAGRKIRTAFNEAFFAVSARRLTSLVPSPLGLLEASVERAYAPLHTRLHDNFGAPTPLTLLIDALRQLEPFARRHSLDRINLTLPPPVFTIYETHAETLRPTIDGTFGRRIDINQHDDTDIRIETL